MTGSNRTIRPIKFTGTPTDISGQFKKKKEAFYQFKLGSSSNLSVTLSDFATNANVDLQLLNQKKRVLSKSTNPGNAAESISTALKKGEYLLRVVNKRSKIQTGYRLRISTSNASSPSAFDSPDAALTAGSQSLLAKRGQTTVLTSAQLKGLSTTRQANSQLRYTITETPRNGTLMLNGKALGAGGGFTQADLDQGRVSYRNASQGATVLGNGANPLVSGFNIVWQGPGGSDGGADNEIFLFDGKTTRQLTTNTVDDRVQRKGIDGNYVVWASQVGPADSRGNATYDLFGFNGTTTTRLTNNAVNDVFISVNGANLFWSSAVGAADQTGQPTYELFYSKDGVTRQLTNNNVNEAVDEFQAAQGATLAWEAPVGSPDPTGRRTSEIFYFNGSEIKQLTNNNYDDYSPRVDGGRVVWEAKSGPLDLGSPTSEVFFYDGNTTRQLTSNNFDDSVGVIKGSTIVWMSRSGTADSLGRRTYEIYRFDGATTQRLTNNSYDDSIVDVDGSSSLWMGMAGQPDAYGQRHRELFFSDGTKTTQLTNNQVDDITAGSVGSKVVWYSQTGAARQGTATRDLFYFDGTTVQQLTNDTKDDDNPSFSDSTLAWRSTDGISSQILKYDLGDQFSFSVSGSSSQKSANQAFKVQLV